MKQFLVILRGSPASGKTTIARQLRNFDKKIAWLKVDNFKDFFAEDSSIALNYVNGSAIATLKYLFDQGFSVAIDGIFQDPQAIYDALEVAKGKSVKALVYEIKCPLNILLDRDRNRTGIKEGFRKPMGDEAITKIFQALESTPIQGSLPLDTANQSVDQCIRTIYSSLGE